MFFVQAERLTVIVKLQKWRKPFRSFTAVWNTKSLLQSFWQPFCSFPAAHGGMLRRDCGPKNLWIC